MSLHCIRGCTRKGRHLSTCGTPCDCACHQGATGAYPCSVDGGCHEAHRPDADCKGCEPKIASVGQLCLTDHGRLVEHLGRIPDLISHIREHVEPGAVRRDSQVKGTRTPPAPLALDAVDAADALYAVLASWHETATDELALTAIARHGWFAGSADQIAGLKAGGAGNDSVRLATRLLTHLERCCQYEWVGEMATEIGDVVRSTLRRWPDQERPSYLPTPCPACDLMSLVRYAPQTFEGKSSISCRACGEAVAEDLYDWQTKRVLASRQAEAAEQAATDAGRAEEEAA